MLLIINCADTSVSVNKSDDLKNRRKIGEVLDSVRHLYYKDSIPQKPYFNNPLQRNDTINNLTHKELTDTSLIYSSLDSSHLTNRINKDSRQKKLNISHIIIGKDSNSISKSIKHIFSMDLIILRGFYLQLEFKKDKTIKPQKPYYPLF